MEKKKVYINGGFPLLLYCTSKNNNNDENIKDRFFSSPIINNINIKKILSTNDNKFINDNNDNNEQIEIINNF